MFLVWRKGVTRFHRGQAGLLLFFAKGSLLQRARDCVELDSDGVAFLNKSGMLLEAFPALLRRYPESIYVEYN